MDVFVIPLGRDRYELYSEQPVELEPSAEASPGWMSRVMKRVSAALRDSEERRSAGGPERPNSWFGRLQDRAMAWVVDRIAEQRLLWNLRSATTALAHHPSDMQFEQVMTVVRADLRKSYDRHRRWLVIDSILLGVTTIALGPLFLLIPGVANLPAFYFAFRVLGHFLSMRGAANGLKRVTWTGLASLPLRELRGLGDLEPGKREARIQAVATELRLQHLPTFVERMAVRPA